VKKRESRGETKRSRKKNQSDKNRMGKCRMSGEVRMRFTLSSSRTGGGLESGSATDTPHEVKRSGDSAKVLREDVKAKFADRKTSSLAQGRSKNADGGKKNLGGEAKATCPSERANCQSEGRMGKRDHKRGRKGIDWWTSPEGTLQDYNLTRLLPSSLRRRKKPRQKKGGWKPAVR